MTRNLSILSILFLSLGLGAQNSNTEVALPKKDSITQTTKEPIQYPKFQFGGLFQARYVASGTDNIDINGNYDSKLENKDNGFVLKYVRVQTRVQISERTEIFVLANLADFKDDPKRKVLENASIRYKISPNLMIQIGQFRPWFGIEETIPVDVIKTLEWSNQYNEFAKLGWTSFQIGASVQGNTKIYKIPVQYAVSVVNGNGKNQPKDDDSGKLLSTRWMFGLLKNNKLNLGMNAGYGKSFSRDVHAYAFDASSALQFNKRWGLTLSAEAKEATNYIIFNSLKETERQSLNDYKIRGFYVLPDLRYEIFSSSRGLSALEFSCRYEYLDTNYKLNSNARHTIMPMFGMEFLKNYGARLQVGMRIDHYEHPVENTAKINNNLFIVQVQTRF